MMSHIRRYLGQPRQDKHRFQRERLTPWQLCGLDVPECLFCVVIHVHIQQCWSGQVPIIHVIILMSQHMQVIAFECQVRAVDQYVL